jgi:hypothetical protein
MRVLLITIVLATCGYPLKPLTPYGCKDIRGVCICDSNGEHCEWQWVCVPY